MSFQELLLGGIIFILLFGKNIPDAAHEFGRLWREWFSN